MSTIQVAGVVRGSRIRIERTSDARIFAHAFTRHGQAFAFASGVHAHISLSRGILTKSDHATLWVEHAAIDLKSVADAERVAVMFGLPIADNRKEVA